MENSDWYSPNLSTTEDGTNNTTMAPDVVMTAANCTFPSPALPNFSSGSEAAVVTATICALYSLFGVVCTFFGYRCFKAVMYFTGFIFASIVVYLICLEENVLPLWSNALIAVCAGVLFGLITLLVQYVGLFMLGFHSGLLLGLVGLCVAEDPFDVRPASPWVAVGILLLAGLVMALCNLYFQKSLTIFGSALYGGAIVVTTLDYFLEQSIMLLWAWDKVRVQQSAPPCWFSWAILAVWPGCLITGIITQACITGRGTYHEKQFPPVSQRHRASKETREERKQRKYRYLYQVRTCHGDVISQPIPGKYVQQVNETMQSSAA